MRWAHALIQGVTFVGFRQDGFPHRGFRVAAVTRCGVFLGHREIAACGIVPRPALPDDPWLHDMSARVNQPR